MRVRDEPWVADSGASMVMTLSADFIQDYRKSRGYVESLLTAECTPSKVSEGFSLVLDHMKVRYRALVESAHRAPVVYGSSRLP